MWLLFMDTPFGKFRTTRFPGHPYTISSGNSCEFLDKFRERLFQAFITPWSHKVSQHSPDIRIRVVRLAVTSFNNMTLIINKAIIIKNLISL